MHEIVAGIGRPQVVALAGVRAYGLGAKAQHLALLHQELRRLAGRPGRVLSGVVEVLISLGVGALGPVGAHQHPVACTYAAVLRFKGLDVGDGEQVVGVGLGLRAAVDHAGRRDEILHRDGVHRVVGQVTARDPVDGRVKVRASVLAAGKVIPVPARAPVVVGRDFLDAKGPALAHFGRQGDLRKFRCERLGQIDHADAAAGQGQRDGGKGGRAHSAPPAAISRSSTLGLSRQRSSHSWATSPG